MHLILLSLLPVETCNYIKINAYSMPAYVCLQRGGEGRGVKGII
jgi:hypothetical protein